MARGQVLLLLLLLPCIVERAAGEGATRGLLVQAFQTRAIRRQPARPLALSPVPWTVYPRS